MRKLLGAILSLVALAPHTSLAQPPQRGVEVRVRNERGQVETVRLYEGSYSLVIGAVNYRHWDKLGGVSDDIPAVRGALERHGFKVEELVDPTADELLPRINRFINEYGLRPNNRLVIYFSGHGYTEVAEDGRKFGYIVPVDAPKPAKDLEGFQRKAITMDEIETAARRIRSKHALFVFDSCFSGSLVNKGGVRVPPIIDYYAARPVRQFITAGADNQEVPEESVFRQVFVRGLEGKADTNRDGYITGTELAIYLQEQVIYYRGNSQTPQYGKIRDPRLDTGDFIFTLPTPPPASAESAQARSLAGQALVRLMRGEYDEAMKLANQSLNLDNAIALAYGVRGHAQVRLGERGSGIKDLETANQIDGRNGVLRALLSSGYWIAGNDNLSKVTAQEAVRLLAHPNDGPSFHARAMAHHMLMNYDSAIADNDRAIELTPQLANAYNNRGLAHRAKGDNERAVADYTKTIELNPQHGIAYSNRGNVYYDKGDYDRAVADYTKAIALNPRDANAYNNRGNAYYSKNDFDRAITDYDRAIGLSPRDYQLYYNRGLAHNNKGDSGRALADYDRVIDLNPRYADVYNGRGNIHYNKGDNNRAIADYSEAIRLNPDFIIAYRNRADAYEKIGEAAKAKADRDKAAELEKRGVKP